MTDIVIFPKIFRSNFLGEWCEGWAAILMVFGGEVEWASRSEQPFGDGTTLYQKPTPKRDKESGHFMG